MRIFVRSDNGKDATMEPYYYDSGYDSVTHWRYGYRPGALFGMACFSSEETGTVYLPGLEKACKVRLGNTAHYANFTSRRASRCRSATI